MTTMDTAPALAVPASLAGQTVIVVGAGAGIGRATAMLLAQRGATVVCVDRNPDTAKETATDLCGGGLAASCITADVAQPESVDAAFDEAGTRHGQLHAVVNCAGVQGTLGKRSHEVELADFDEVYAVNLRGALAVTRAAIRHMMPYRYGRIAHVASIAGKEGNPGMISYSTTKAGLIGMVKAQGKEYAEDGITINALAPAVIHTAFLDTQPEEVVRYMLERIPMRRPGTVVEAAQILAWMVSPECSFTTGATFDLSGGRATY